MELIQWFVRNPVKVSVGVLLVALFGAIALFRMPMQLTPEVQTPTITISTRWPGASPQEVEREIIQEQEEQLKGVEGITKMTSESRDSLGQITLEFLVGTDMSEALLKVNTRLQQVREYPEDADEPVISTSSASDRPIAWFILSQRNPTDEAIVAFREKHPELRDDIERVRRASSSGLAMLRLRDLAAQHPEVNDLIPARIDVPELLRFAEDFIEAKFERVPGVSDSQVRGGREEEMQVIVDPQRLAARQLTIDDLRGALRGQNKDTSGGDFWEGKRRYVVRTLGQFNSPEQVERAVVAYRNGAPVYVRDVAEVRPGYKKPDGLVRRFGDTAIAMNCQRETGANVLDVMTGLREAVNELNDGILKQRGLQITQVYDETDYIYSAVGLVKNNIILAGFLTVAVLLLFLRSGRSTIVIGLAIPTCIIGTFLVLNSLGRSLNVISLAGLAFAVGMLVDNSVVVLENIYRHYQQGDDAVTAAVRGSTEVWGAVMASTLTTLAVFLPVLFVEEEAGQLFRDIALAISAAVGLSLIVSVVVIPTASAKILRGRAGHDQSGTVRVPGAAEGSRLKRLLVPVDAFGGGFIRLVVGVNAWLQRGILRRLVAVAGLFGAAVAFSYLMMPKVEYLPNGNRNLVFGILLPPPGYNIEQLLEIGQRIENATRPYWDVDLDDPNVAKLDYPAIEDFFFVAWGRQAIMGLRAANPLRAGELVPLIREVGSTIPGTFAIAKQSSLFERGLSAGRTIDVEIAGPDLTRLVELGGRVMGQVSQVVPGAQALPKPSLDLSNPEVHVTPKTEQAADMGLTNVDLGYAVDALVDGAYASDYFTGGDKIDLTIIGQERFAYRTQDIRQLPITTPTGDLVPLAAVADVTLASGPEQINHRERQRAITIEVTPPPEMALEEAMDRITRQIIEPLISSGQLEGLYQINLSGTADKLRATWRALRFNFVLALLITYLLMAALFESWLYPFVIIFSVPLGAVGGFAGLWLLNRFVLQPLDVLTMLGFVILIGTVVNNPILIVHQALNHMRDEDMPMREAILESVRTRIRPIFMTTSTTVLALLPLVLFPGAGSELYRGLGSVVLGGLAVSTIFTLFLVPALFSLSMEARGEAIRVLGIGEGQKTGTTTQAEKRAAMS
ncbi:MAG: efflux RND transporter permease subunit [Phycisphaerae bacterium]|nr:efflux RND transporter permease subunit [Phycisphaerae bacterium]